VRGDGCGSLGFVGVEKGTGEPRDVERLVPRVGVVVPREGVLKDGDSAGGAANLCETAARHDVDLQRVDPEDPVRLGAARGFVDGSSSLVKRPLCCTGSSGNGIGPRKALV
jgi:hypothetical protein